MCILIDLNIRYAHISIQIFKINKQFGGKIYLKLEFFEFGVVFDGSGILSMVSLEESAHKHIFKKCIGSIHLTDLTIPLKILITIVQIILVLIIHALITIFFGGCFLNILMQDFSILTLLTNFSS